MSVKATRSSKPLPETATKTRIAKAPAVYKVFYISEALINEETNELHLEQFYHPGRNGPTWFITHGTTDIMEILEFAEPRRSWLIGNEICSNGRIYITAPMDVTFLILHQLRKHCSSRAHELETIFDEQDSSVKRLMTHFATGASLSCIADIKSAGDMTFYKYNPKKAMAWLSLKTKRLATALKQTGIHCGRSALSQNYMRSEKATEEIVQEVDYLRMASDIIGTYLDLELHDELIAYLNIPKEIKTVDEKDINGKRKSLSTLNGGKNKKPKVDNDGNDAMETNGAAAQLKNSSLLDETLDKEQSEMDSSLTSTSPVIARPTPLKERVLTAKEKALAKGAKGTKSIASFFKK